MASAVSAIKIEETSPHDRHDKRKRGVAGAAGRKARQAEKNRETARRFRNKMINLQEYMDSQVKSLTEVCRALAFVVIKYGKAPELNRSCRQNSDVRRTRTSHI